MKRKGATKKRREQAKAQVAAAQAHHRRTGNEPRGCVRHPRIPDPNCGFCQIWAKP